MVERRTQEGSVGAPQTGGAPATLPLAPGVVLPRPAIVGILNLTPDSFSDGNILASLQQVVARAKRLVADGAHMLDLGAESTRPGFVPVPAAEEWRRLEGPLQAVLAALPDVPLSVDTRHAATAAKALALGVRVINDVSACADAAMAMTVARANAVVVLMHGFGAAEPEAQPASLDAVANFLATARDRVVGAGVAANKVWLDPGIGFAKNPQQNLALLGQLAGLQPLGCPVYFGPSRKRFLAAVTGHNRPCDRDPATAASCAIAVMQGADLLRVHAPAAVRDAVAVAAAVRVAAGEPIRASWATTQRAAPGCRQPSAL